MSEGPFEFVGEWVGIGIGIGIGIATFPVTQLDSPLIGPADALWFAATLRAMSSAKGAGGGAGWVVDEALGFHDESDEFDGYTLSPDVIKPSNPTPPGSSSNSDMKFFTIDTPSMVQPILPFHLFRKNVKNSNWFRVSIL